mmetsp:Transcript_95610/g.308623  ORF Transcript_95610/g.308623 Transcript_95610/m.308623 type:complete len:200 (-) Transcript_95610:370-969(-)
MPPNCCTAGGRLTWTLAKCGRMVGCGGVGPTSSQVFASSSLNRSEGSRGAAVQLPLENLVLRLAYSSPSRPPAKICSTASAMVSSTRLTPPNRVGTRVQATTLQEPPWPQGGEFQLRQPRQEGRWPGGGEEKKRTTVGRVASRRSSAQLGTCSSSQWAQACGNRKNSMTGSMKCSLHCKRLALWPRLGVTRRLSVWQSS